MTSTPAPTPAPTPSPDSRPQASTSSAGWTSTTDLPALASWLRTKRKVAVLTHVKPDGDAVGSTMALTRALNHAGAVPGLSTPPIARAWYFGPRPSWMRRVVGDSPATSIESLAEIADEPVDAIVIVDTGSWAQLEIVRPWLETHSSIIAVVDHHAQGDPALSDRRVIDVSSAAVCQPVAELCRLLLNRSSLRELPADVAEPLYLGLATDTGWFRHSNVGPRVMQTAADLLAAGVDHVSLYANVEQRERVARLRLLAKALSSLTLHDNDRVAVMMLTRKDFAESGAQAADAGGFADHAQSLESVFATLVLTEADPAEFGRSASPGATLTKVSLRSKAVPGSVDVNAVAGEFGGGGHVRAAGAKLHLPLAETRDRLLAAIARRWGS